jgi:hypothetical protein
VAVVTYLWRYFGFVGFELSKFRIVFLTAVMPWTELHREEVHGEIAVSSDLPPVWPWQDGNTRGVGLEPLYKNVPRAALHDPALYQLLALVDAIRDGRARERNLAERDLVRRLRSVHGQS